MTDLPCGFSPTKARGKRPVPMWADRFLRDTLELSAEEIGAYHLILYAMWKRPDCALPLDHRKLAIIARVSLRKWNSRVGPAILELMDVSGDVITSKKLSEEARQTEDWCTTQHGRKCEACKLSRDKSHFSDTPSFRKDNEKKTDKILKTKEPPVTGDTTGDEPGNHPGINHPKDPTYKVGGGNAGARENTSSSNPDDPLPDKLFPDDGNPSAMAEAVPDGMRERILETIGVDPVSGLTGRGGNRLGTASDYVEVSRWICDHKIRPDQIVTIVGEVMSTRSDPGPPSSFRYFTPAMERFARDRDAPPERSPKPRGPRNGKSSFTAEVHDLAARLDSGEVELSTASRDPWAAQPGPDVDPGERGPAIPLRSDDGG